MDDAGRVFLAELSRPRAVGGEVVCGALHLHIWTVLDALWVLPVDLLHGALDVAVRQVGVLLRPFADAREEELG